MSVAVPAISASAASSTTFKEKPLGLAQWLAVRIKETMHVDRFPGAIASLAIGCSL
jgi:hypothetical protein